MSTQNPTALAETTKNQLSVSERFTSAVLQKFASENGTPSVTPFQKRLIQSYFIKIDQTLKLAEIKRMAKGEQYREDLAYSWENINMNKLAVDVVAFSSVGLDPMQKNHLHPIPYKNTALKKYDLQFTMGYNGLELKAKKYGLDVPDNVIIKLVYSNEKFTPIYKDFENKVESFTHLPSENPFEKGEIIGGYYYYQYFDTPEKNSLRLFSKKDIEKRIPKTASAEFWGGEKDKWEGGKKAGKEQVEGWYDEMCWKTIKRAAYDAIPIDSQKIDEHIQSVISESNYTETLLENKQDVSEKVQTEIKTNANKKEIDFDNIEEAEVVDEEIVASEVKENKTETATETQPNKGGQIEAGF
jgi:recombination protein RecT